MADPLWEAGCAWLGRDPEHGTDPAQPLHEGIAEVTAEARGYGFHCTLKAPMRLATSYADLRQDLAALALAVRPFDLPPLAVADLSGFLALRETEPCPPLQAFADLATAWPDRHRHPPDAAELQRRRGAGLPADMDALLLRWGYPGVFARWRFHMTLTRRLSPTEQAVWRPAAAAHFRAALAVPRRVETLSVFTQSGPGAPFLLAERIALAG